MFDTRRGFLLGSLGSIAALGVGGCGNLYPFTAHKQATPNPLANQKVIGVMPVDLTNLTVDAPSVDAYLPGGASYDSFTRVFIETYERALVTVLQESKMKVLEGPPSSGASAWVRTRLTYFEPGMTLGGLYNEASEAKLTVDVLGAGGEVLDTITLEAFTRGKRNKLQVGDGIKSDARELANNTGMYLMLRQSGWVMDIEK